MPTMNTRAAARPAVHAIQPSLIRKVANAAIGRSDIIPLWFGEPDRPTPPFIRAAAKDAIDEGQTFYQPNLGIPELRGALAAYTNNLYSTRLSADNVAITPSGMTALSLALQCVVTEGDTLAIVAPVWPNLPAAAGLLGARLKPVSIKAQDKQWRLDLDELFAACDHSTSAIMINSPNNPTGWMLEDDEQRHILEFCRERDIWLIADEVYNRIVYDRRCAPSFIDKVSENDKYLIINSFSKSWAMTGWRLGWITAPRSLLHSLEMLAEYNFSSIFAPTQIAGITALQEGETFIAASIERYRVALNFVTEAFAELPRVTFPQPRATFYAFFAVDGVCDSFDFALKALNKTSVGLAPGAAFGPQGEGYLRLCYAADLGLLQRALDQMKPLLT